ALDARPRGDPLVGRFHHPLEVVVREDVRRSVGAEERYAGPRPLTPGGAEARCGLGLRYGLAAVVVPALRADHVRRTQLLALGAGDERRRLQRVVAAAGVAAGGRRALLGYWVLGHIG